MLLAYEDAFKLALYSLKNSLIDKDFEVRDLGQTFESGRNVNRIADHCELHSLFRANVARDGFPVTDPDSGFDGRFLGSGLPEVERLQRVTHAEGGADGAERIIRPGDRRAEDRHHGVPDELVESTLLVEDLPDHQREVLVQQSDKVLRGVLFGEGGEAADITKENGDFLTVSAELQLVPVFQNILGDLTRNVATQGTHQPLFFRDVLGDRHNPHGVLLAVPERDDAQVHAYRIARREDVLEVVGLIGLPGGRAAPELRDERLVGRAQELLHAGTRCPVRLQTEDGFEGGVDAPDAAVRVHRHHPGGHGSQNALVIISHVDDGLEQPGVIERDEGLRREGGQELLVFAGEDVALLVQNFGDTDDLALRIVDGGAEDRPRPVAGPFVHRLVEARIAVRVGDVDALSGSRHHARNAAPDRNADFDQPGSLGDLGPDLLGFPVDHEQGAPLGVHHF